MDASDLEAEHNRVDAELRDLKRNSRKDAVDFITLEMFGGKGDARYSGDHLTNVPTDNVQAWADAEGYLASQAALGESRGGVLRIGIGQYYCSTAINLNHRLTVVGSNGAGQAGKDLSDRQSMLLFPSNAAGLFINSQTTLGGADVPESHSGIGSLIERLALVQLKGSTDRTKHGIQASARFRLNDVNVFDFAGDGLHINSGVPNSGNINFFHIDGMRITGCQNGVAVAGGDTNGGDGYSINVENNRAFGIRDGSFLGCDWYGCKADGNGTFSWCSFAGNRYYAMIDDVVVLRATTPGTNALVWALKGAGGITTLYREWTPGNTLEWVRGGPGALLGDQARSSFFGGYLGESNQPPLVIMDNNWSFGGRRSAGIIGTGGWINARDIVNANQISGKNLSIKPPSSVIPASNGEVTFQLTSNTSLTFKVKGSDGVVRSGSLPLA